MHVSGHGDTKFGFNIVDGKMAGMNSRPEHIREACDASLKRLGVEVSARLPTRWRKARFLAGRPVAALVYRRGTCVIDLYVWPKLSKLPIRSRSANEPDIMSSTGAKAKWCFGPRPMWKASTLRFREAVAVLPVIQLRIRRRPGFSHHNQPPLCSTKTFRRLITDH
jgi:hypothetical protein